MDPALNEELWECSKLSRKPYFNQRDKKWLFNLLWIRSSHAMSGYKIARGSSNTKEICGRYNTEEECLKGINKVTIRCNSSCLYLYTYNNILYKALLALRKEKDAEYRKRIMEKEEEEGKNTKRQKVETFQAPGAKIYGSPLADVTKYLAYDQTWQEVKLNY